MIQPYFKAATQPGVVAIGVAQEFQSVLTAYDRSAKTGEPKAAGSRYGFAKEDRRVTVYYFYIADAEFGLGFIKLCAYFPYPGKVWVNGHEWAKRQAQTEGLAFTELANGFASCADPARLQAICDRLGPADLQAFFDRWMAVIPTPLHTSDQEAGYWWELSMRQVETSRTLVFDTPRRARGFFEALVADNLDLGRPDEVQLTFGRQIRSNTDSPFSTKVVTRGVDVIVNVFYKHSRIKEYLKEGRALRIETVCNSPTDLGCNRSHIGVVDGDKRVTFGPHRLMYEAQGVANLVHDDASRRVRNTGDRLLTHLSPNWTRTGGGSRTPGDEDEVRVRSDKWQKFDNGRRIPGVEAEQYLLPSSRPGRHPYRHSGRELPRKFSLRFT